MIADLTPGDLEACVSLYVATFNAPPWSESWTIDDATQRLGDFVSTPRAVGVCLTTDDGGDLMGFALGRRERSEGRDHFFLQEMCVRTDARRSGHGSRLLEALTSRLDDVQHWYLLTARDSDASAFYERHGFRPAGRMGVFVRL